MLMIVRLEGFPHGQGCLVETAWHGLSKAMFDTAVATRRYFRPVEYNGANRVTDPRRSIRPAQPGGEHNSGRPTGQCMARVHASISHERATFARAGPLRQWVPAMPNEPRRACGRSRPSRHQDKPDVKFSLRDMWPARTAVPTLSGARSGRPHRLRPPRHAANKQMRARPARRFGRTMCGRWSGKQSPRRRVKLGHRATTKSSQRKTGRSG
jgi:hypothetical protein